MRARLAVATLVMASLPAFAQVPGAVSAPAASENGRFVLRETPDGLLRMDTRTGVISVCTRATGAFTCRLAPDDKVALEQEIERLKAENDTLRRSGGQAARPAQPGGEGMNLPSDAEIDRALSLAERIWRRLRGMIRESEDNPLPERRL
ncbi:MAG: hypothetical protein Q8O26_01425 [Phreatobacter sp.]|uniref:hypothetical protein n=1 Tax=Phreatobacter sp. TaxID=1966341 RepID=UPI0027358220|nr:hypothetical protein [Phreatobacter sp.]MDP2800521.1 hypothetical protein [Phreatobacter sp.]